MRSTKAQTLAGFCADNLAGFSEDNLPGQPLTGPTALLPWDPGSPSPQQPTGQPPTHNEERSSLPRRRGATFEPEPLERRRRPARLPSQDEEEEDEKLTSEAPFRRSVTDASALRGANLMDPLASRRPRATGANQRLSNAPGLQVGMGQGPVKRPAAKALQPTPGGATSMANQLKVQYCCCFSLLSLVSLPVPHELLTACTAIRSGMMQHCVTVAHCLLFAAHELDNLAFISSLGLCLNMLFTVCTLACLLEAS